MNNQIAFIDVAPMKKQRNNTKRNWLNAFQKWSDKHFHDTASTLEYGICGTSEICDYCLGEAKPCANAFNCMVKEKNIRFDWGNRNFEKVWNGDYDRAVENAI